MKHPKRPTRRQKAAIADAGLDPYEWLVVSVTNGLKIIDREGTVVRTIGGIRDDTSYMRNV